MPKHQEIALFMGLGDDGVVDRQTRIVNWLNRRRPNDAQIRIFPTLWQTQESYRDKRRRAQEFMASNPKIRVLYGISAGASLVMGMVPDLPICTEYHFVSGKLRYPETIGEERRKRAPALVRSVEVSEGVINDYDLSSFDMTCHIGFLDGVLRQRDMRVPDVAVDRIPMIYHSTTIALAYFTLLRKL